MPTVPWEEYVSIFRSRDLFAPLCTAEPGNAQEGGSFRIKGIMLGAENSIVLEQDGLRNIFLAEGEREGDIHLKEVSRHAVVLEIGQRTLVLKTEEQI